MSPWQRLLLTSLLFTLPLTSNAMFAGIYVAHGSGDNEVKFNNNTPDFSDRLDSSTFNIHLGFNLENNNRFIISLDSVRISDCDCRSDDAYAGGLRFDWQFVYGQKDIKPFWGVGFGLYGSDDIYDDVYLSSLSLQVMAGFKFNVNETVEIDLSIQSQAFGWEDVQYYNGSTYEGRAEQITSHTTLGVGIDFSF